MKLILIFCIIIAIAAVAATAYLTLSGMAVSGSNIGIGDAGEIIQTAAAKTASLSQYDVTYGVTNTLQIASQSIVMSGTLRTMHSSSANRMLVNLQAQNPNNITQSESVSQDIYSLPSGMFSCSTSFSGIACERLNETPQIQNPVEQADLLLNLSAQGFVSMQSKGSQTAASRPCDSVLFTYDIAKLLAATSLPEGVASGIKEMSTRICFDSETGLPIDLEQNIRIEAEAAATSSMKMTATQLALTVPEIKLPESAMVY